MLDRTPAIYWQIFTRRGQVSTVGRPFNVHCWYCTCLLFDSLRLLSIRSFHIIIIVKLPLDKGQTQVYITKT